MNSGEKIILFGGSFDPPHLGHLIVAQWVAEALKSAVRFLPGGDPPHKKPFSPGEHRLEMLKIATAGNPLFVVDDYEYKTGKVNYTVETLGRYREDFGLTRDNLYFILGSDSLGELLRWRDPQGIAAQATLVVFPRDNLDWQGLLGPLQPLQAKLIICQAPLIQVSSTLVRQRLRDGLSVRYLVPLEVENYIRQMGLYQEGFSPVNVEG
jgi:nicotinate-nucleotide adenylyltransferase